MQTMWDFEMQLCTLAIKVLSLVLALTKRLSLVLTSFDYSMIRINREFLLEKLAKKSLVTLANFLLCTELVYYVTGIP